jgi:hypothetical protein
MRCVEGLVVMKKTVRHVLHLRRLGEVLWSMGALAIFIESSCDDLIVATEIQRMKRLGQKRVGSFQETKWELWSLVFLGALWTVCWDTMWRQLLTYTDQRITHRQVEMQHE